MPIERYARNMYRTLKSIILFLPDLDTQSRLAYVEQKTGASFRISIPPFVPTGQLASIYAPSLADRIISGKASVGSGGINKK